MWLCGIPVSPRGHSLLETTLIDDSPVIDNATLCIRRLDQLFIAARQALRSLVTDFAPYPIHKRQRHMI